MGDAVTPLCRVSKNFSKCVFAVSSQLRVIGRGKVKRLLETQIMRKITLKIYELNEAIKMYEKKNHYFYWTPEV